MRGMDEKRFKRICHTMREDGAFIEAGENDNLIVQKIEANPNALGIFGYSFLEENQDKLRGTKIDGVEPTYETISSGKYAPSRPLFIYIKKAHIGVIPGLKEFVDEYVSEKAIGEEGYLGGTRPRDAAEVGPREDACRRQVVEEFRTLSRRPTSARPTRVHSIQRVKT